MIIVRLKNEISLGFLCEKSVILNANHDLSRENQTIIDDQPMCDGDLAIATLTFNDMAMPT